MRRYVPELTAVPDSYLAEPWRMPEGVQREAGCVIGEHYPGPIVDPRWRAGRRSSAIALVRPGGCRETVFAAGNHRLGRGQPHTLIKPVSEATVVEVQMPQMGESVTEGTILEWHVAEGEEVAEGDTVVEVSTDKIDAEVPAPASSVVTKILAQPDDTVEVRTGARPDRPERRPIRQQRIGRPAPLKNPRAW